MEQKPERPRTTFGSHHRQGISLSADGKPWIDFEKTCSMDRFCKGVPTKNALLSTDKGAFFELSVPLARNVKYASQVKRGYAS